jgi:hypothetical protein
MCYTCQTTNCAGTVIILLERVNAWRRGKSRPRRLKWHSSDTAYKRTLFNDVLTPVEIIKTWTQIVSFDFVCCRHKCVVARVTEFDRRIRLQRIINYFPLSFFNILAITLSLSISNNNCRPKLYFCYIPLILFYSLKENKFRFNFQIGLLSLSICTPQRHLEERRYGSIHS